MKTKQDRHRITMGGVKTFAFVLLFSLAGCGGQDEPTAGEKPDEPVVEKPGDIQLSDTEIRLEVAEWKPLQESRAVLFDQENFLEGNEANTLPGGNFTLHAYTSDGQTFLKGARGWYFADTDKPEWRFRSDIDGNVTFPTYYWPNSGTVNFFAYMPYEGYQPGLKHYVNNFQYSQNNGQTFDCALPATNADDVNEIEFIYAYETGKNKENNPLVLHFKHPFAAISFLVKGGSYRMTVKSIQFNNIHQDGTFSCQNAAWTSGTAADTYTVDFGEEGITIPDEVNQNTVFGGPYLVMPQTFEGMTITVTVMHGEDEVVKTFNMSDLKAGVNGDIEHTKWEQGKKYIYSLGGGNQDEEIYFHVKVVDWDVKEGDNKIDVE